MWIVKGIVLRLARIVLCVGLMKQNTSPTTGAGETAAQYLRRRIMAAENRGQLYYLEIMATKHYNAGTISANEFAKLDVLVMERVAIKRIEEGL